MSQSVVLLKGPMISPLWMPVHTPQGNPTHEVSPRRGFLDGMIIIRPVYVSSFTLLSLWHLTYCVHSLRRSLFVPSASLPIYLKTFHATDVLRLIVLLRKVCPTELRTNRPAEKCRICNKRASGQTTTNLCLKEVWKPKTLKNMRAWEKAPKRLNDTRTCLLYTSPSPRDQRGSRMPSSA